MRISAFGQQFLLTLLPENKHTQYSFDYFAAAATEFTFKSLTNLTQSVFAHVKPSSFHSILRPS